MASILDNTERIGNFTSSEIYLLMKEGKKKGEYFGTAALSYIEEKKYERNLGRSIQTETDARPLKWGKLLEKRVNDLLPFEYQYCSSTTVSHPTIAYWKGSPDVIANRPRPAIGDIKCPATLKSFCQLVQPIYDGLTGMDAMNKVRAIHPDGEKFYWQILSNAILTDRPIGELIPYMPFESELSEIRKMVDSLPGDEMADYYFLSMAEDKKLPFLKDGGYYNNLNTIQFEIPPYDKERLTERVLRAGELLTGNSEPPSIILAERDPNHAATIISKLKKIK